MVYKNYTTTRTMWALFSKEFSPSQWQRSPLLLKHTIFSNDHPSLRNIHVTPKSYEQDGPIEVAVAINMCRCKVTKDKRAWLYIRDGDRLYTLYYIDKVYKVYGNNKQKEDVTEKIII